MDTRQEKIVDFLRALYQRDRRGPGDFPIREMEEAAHLQEPQIAKDLSAPLSLLIDRKRIEQAKRGLMAPPPAPAAPPAGPPKPATPVAAPAPAAPGLTPQAADAFARALGNQPLSDDDVLQLESIVLPALRPAFDIQNETYETLPTVWDPLNRQRPQIEPIVRGIGRLQLTGHPSYTLVGTGFVCGPNAIATNRHVAQIFVQGVESGGQLCFQPGVTCAMEMLAEVGSADSLKVDLSRPVAVSTAWDVAVLRVESLPAGVAPLPLCGTTPAALDGGVATVIGYPSYDPRESFVDQANIFRAVFDRKRLQPGKLNGRADVPSFGRTVSAIAHDCSTLGGNSGSALVSADTAQVVGIHFCGITHVSNYAVPAWELVADPAFADCGIHFV
ncbi:MAG TPA: serine protease [Acidobacteriaceae bacterium]|nr:serine protease [Acidobacteriaceae bacterium]